MPWIKLGTLIHASQELCFDLARDVEMHVASAVLPGPRDSFRHMQILSAPPEIELDSIDQRVYMNLRWEQFEAFLRARGDTSANRIAYLDGVLEIMSPSDNHEVIKKNIARLLEAWALREDVELEGYGSWTLKQRRKKSGVEPDECYFRGPRAGRKVPDLALEVVWTTGGTDKLEIYRRLGTREVWIWEAGAIRVFCLGASGYTRFTRSSVLPELDVRLLSRYCTRPDQHRAVKAFLRALSKH